MTALLVRQTSWQLRASLFLCLLSVAVLIGAQPAFAQKAGILLEHKAMSGVPTAMQAWRIRYTSTNEKGGVHEVTGIVAAPIGNPSKIGRPVLAWAHGTWGVADKCSPSTSKDFVAATPAVEEAVRRGYVFVATDYEGLGTPGAHPYLIGGSAARSVLDAVRATQAITEAGASRRFAVWGESQGGHAALWTGQLARSYAPELELTGIAAAAPPTDLIQNLTSGDDPSVRAFLTAFTANSWSEYYGASLKSLGNKSTGDIINRLARNNCVTLGAKPKVGAIIGVMVLRTRLKNVNLGRISPWAEIARDNSPARRDYGIPFLIAQNDKDVIVAPDITKAFVRDLCRDRATVKYIKIVGEGGHSTSASDSATETLDWIDARFAGTKAPSDCRNF